MLRNARVIYLRVSYDEAMSRIQGDRFRPLLSRPGLDEVYQRRLPIYEDVSVFTIDTDGRRPDAIAHDVLAELTRLPSIPPRSSSVLVTPVGGSYYAHIGPGLADRVDTLLPALPDAERGVIIEAAEDTAVAARVAERFDATGIATHRVAMPDTQASKTFRAAVQRPTRSRIMLTQGRHLDNILLAPDGRDSGSRSCGVWLFPPRRGLAWRCAARRRARGLRRVASKASPGQDVFAALALRMHFMSAQGTHGKALPWFSRLLEATLGWYCGICQEAPGCQT